MNESNKLIENKSKISLQKKKLNLRIKINKNYIKQAQSNNKNIGLIITFLLVFLLFFLFALKLYKTKIKNNINIISINTTKNISNSINGQNINDNISLEILSKIKFNTEKIKNEIDNNSEYDPNCNQLDPINIFNRRLQDNYTTICQNGISRHICYKNKDTIFVATEGLICTMENIIIDPSNWKSSGFIYKGPVDKENRGCPILNKGFFNMKCEKNITEITGFDGIYRNYYFSWNYDYNEKEDEEELAPGKTVFFISRNQDSPNLFHGGSEFINALSMIYLLDINPENIQVVFLDSIVFNDDPFYDLYKHLVSRGGEPIYIRNLTKKYHISSGIHVPINWDSPCFIYSEVPTCTYPTITYKFYNELIDKYMNIPNFEDSFKSDNETFYYPQSFIDKHNSSIKFKKIVTFQWRRVWPRGRLGQYRILGNGPQLADKLSKFLPNNILLRLIDTASLPISEQIAILRKTDYYVGIHGAGLALSIFSPSHCILHEVLPSENMNGLLLMGALSGHKTYSDIISSNIHEINGTEMVFFNEEEFAESVIEHMKENKFFD